MAVATPIRRYDKNQILIVNDREIRLIDHIKELRTEKKITKKKISNLVKHNDYWYSQVERDGKNGDDNRQRTIYRPDLIKIISAVKFNALTPSAMEAVSVQSENYIDKVIKASPVKESLKKLQMYNLPYGRPPELQDRLIKALLTTQTQLLYQTFKNLDYKDKDKMLDQLSNLNTCLKIDPCFIVSLYGLPFMDFLYEAKLPDIDNLFSSILQLIDKVKIDPKYGDFSPFDLYSEISEQMKNLPKGNLIANNKPKVEWTNGEIPEFLWHNF